MADIRDRRDAAMNLLLLASHAVAEFDDLRMFTDLGYDTFVPGGYEVPSRANGEGIRPSLPDAPHHPELVAACERQRQIGGEPGAAIDWAKARLHDDLIDWADAIIVHHFPERWIGWQWDRIRHKRVIWRTCGQSDPAIEDVMSQYRGLQIVRYSPKERGYFEKVGSFAGEDALIRFGKYPSDYGPWVGDDVTVGNVTQNMVERGDATGLSFWQEATVGLPTKPAGPGSEALGGVGKLGYDEMREYLRHLRVYLYTGTTPASYTLGLAEAMLSGVPVVSIGPEAWRGPAELFEGHEISTWNAHNADIASWVLATFLDDPEGATAAGEFQRQRAISLFGVETVGRQWQAFLG